MLALCIRPHFSPGPSGFFPEAENSLEKQAFVYWIGRWSEAIGGGFQHFWNFSGLWSLIERYVFVIYFFYPANFFSLCMICHKKLVKFTGSPHNLGTTARSWLMVPDWLNFEIKY